MTKFKLTEYQLTAINSYLANSSYLVEERLLEKYKVSSVEYLNATEYDKIISDLQDIVNDLMQRGHTGREPFNAVGCVGPNMKTVERG